ncbi:menaquinone biosynthesis protein [Nitrospina gracilis]|uniref:menaquinone biosynthesis protein n=1 Tax=Nitrospina gracilis TaxID=35801 RepID=UPI001F2ED0E1|nr:menaquinone biosynthesis protein [Nitrospina gracilis]MCF8719104.1 chorismate dehydratase [Nitrospina gracilis Nb-211]
MPATLKFGFHDFLNAQPLLVPLETTAHEADFEMVKDVPARLADRLHAGELDLAMIPSIEYLSHAAEYRLVPGACIASRGAVDTVLLVLRGEAESVRTVALDERSRTSATLLRILFEEVFPPEVQYSRTHPDLAHMMRTCDAALVIGDQGFSARAHNAGWTVIDLSQRWWEQTGRAFVHAVVAVRREAALTPEMLKAIADAPNRGRASMDAIVRNQVEKTGLDASVVRDYLENKIIYTLGEEEMAGLTLFRDLCFQKKILSARPELQWAAPRTG